MSKMKLQESGRLLSSYSSRLEHWTSKEIQLNVLHGEIVHKREALLNMSRNMLESTKQEELQLSSTEAFVRNDRLLKDIKDLEAYLTDKQEESVNSRYANLQANYKSMVENMFPIWQRSLQELQAGPNNTKIKDG